MALLLPGWRISPCTLGARIAVSNTGWQREMIHRRNEINLSSFTEEMNFTEG